MVADKETPLEHTTIPSRENKKTQTGHTRFTLSQLRALPLHAQPGNGDFWRQNNDKMRKRTRKLTKKTECDGLRAHSSMGKRRHEFWAVCAGGWLGNKRRKWPKKRAKQHNKKNYIQREFRKHIQRELRTCIQLDFLLESFKTYWIFEFHVPKENPIETCFIE